VKVCYFKAGRGVSGKCGYEIVPTSPPTVVISERKDNVGPTVSSSITTIATAIYWDHLAAVGQDPRAIHWIEHRPETRGWSESCTEVFLDWNGLTYSNPRRQPVTLDNIVFVRRKPFPESSTIIEVRLLEGEKQETSKPAAVSVAPPPAPSPRITQRLKMMIQFAFPRNKEVHRVELPVDWK
jgi:hypothetical protein